MPTLRDIRRRIRSVQSTQKITRAMKLVAAAKLRRAQERILAARPYASKMGELLGHLVAAADTDERPVHPLLERRAGPRRQLVVITADRGLAGAFNSNILRRALDWLREAGEADVTLVLVGRKGREFFRRRRQWRVAHTLVGFWDRLAYSHAQELAEVLVEQYLTGTADEVHLLYNEFRSVAVQRPVLQQLLPIPRAEVEGDGAAAVEYLYEPDPETILRDLLPRHVRTQVYRALMESLAGEYGARMTAMEAATKNATEMIEVLTIQYNKARQEKITKELLDIVGGAEALSKGAEA
jgi:F-type H+-transporting ATPase subunit gamma